MDNIINNSGKVSARELYNELGSKRSFSNWWEFKKKQADLIENLDFNLNKVVIVQTEGRRQVARNLDDYNLTITAAKDLCLLEGTESGKKLRRQLIALDNSVEKGTLLPTDKIPYLMQLIRTCFYHERRKDCETIHFNFYDDKYTWNKYRDDLLGISKEQLIDQLKKMNIKYKSKHQALINIDKFKLIENAVIDLLIGIGKNETFAKNVGKVAYDLSKDMNISFMRIGKRTSLFSNQMKSVKTIEELPVYNF